GIDAFHGWNVGRRGQIVDDAVEERLHALVLERGAADHGDDLHGERTLADGAANLVFADLLTLEVLFEQSLVAVGRGLDQLLASALRGGNHVRRDRLLVVLRAETLIVPYQRLHAHELDHAAERVLASERQLEQNRSRLQPLFELLDDPVEI